MCSGIARLYNGCVVLFLDDVQWAESNSVSLLQRLISKCSFALLTILAFRDNEIAPEHCVSKFMTSMDSTQQCQSVELAELSHESVTQFVEINLGIETIDEQLEELITLVYQKTKGNPFFMSQVC